MFQAFCSLSVLQAYQTKVIRLSHSDKAFQKRPIGGSAYYL